MKITVENLKTNNIQDSIMLQVEYEKGPISVLNSGKQSSADNFLLLMEHLEAYFQSSTPDYTSLLKKAARQAIPACKDMRAYCYVLWPDCIALYTADVAS